MLKIKTTKLQEMLARAVQGASCNRLIPLSTLLALEVKDGKLTITTTDKTNYLYVTEEVAGDDFYVCVSVEKFPKLIARLTCEDVELDLKDKYLEVRGNGTYQIEFQLDEDGQMVVFPTPLSDMTENKVGEVKLATIKNILTNFRPALMVKGNRPQFFNYFVGQVAGKGILIATDTNKVSALRTTFFTDGSSRLIMAETMNLLDTMIDDTIDIYADGNKLEFKSEHGVVFGYTPDGLQQFNADKIVEGFIEKEYQSNCKISKAEILQVLDRISIFVDYLDNDVIEIAFKEDGLWIKSRKDNGEEKVPYIECNGFTEFTGIVLLERLRTQIKAQSGDSVIIHFGEQRALKMTDNDAVFITALGSEQ